MFKIITVLLFRKIDTKPPPPPTLFQTSKIRSIDNPSPEKPPHCEEVHPRIPRSWNDSSSKKKKKKERENNPWPIKGRTCNPRRIGQSFLIESGGKPIPADLSSCLLPPPRQPTRQSKHDPLPLLPRNQTTPGAFLTAAAKS